MKRGKHPTSNIQHPTSKREYPTRTEAERNLWELREGEAGRRSFDLEERLLGFASAVIDLSETLPNTRAGNHIAGQVLRSGTSPYPNHGEAEEAESRDDFVHKLKICLKELRETRRWARLVKRKGWAKEGPTLAFVLSEADELIRIFFASIQTARRNALAQKHCLSESKRYSSSEAG
jgi:four helix bundle protein